ncbi:type II toxin-antitoxin system PemK/MazF family toxin [Thermovirga lienii]|uniref:type II toxin-antitoxin system PemK/MazF family toxin n=1 Tax=Thermovirga lienii TaxID=336261 RepID=UPI0026527D4C|nr:mRNA interferase MazF [Thermovirga sp.]
MIERYIPDRGDIIWLEFNPQLGHEQAGKRPALVLSPALYNGKIGLALICPITKQIKGIPLKWLCLKILAFSVLFWPIR